MNSRGCAPPSAIPAAVILVFFVAFSCCSATGCAQQTTTQPTVPAPPKINETPAPTYSAGSDYSVDSTKPLSLLYSTKSSDGGKFALTGGSADSKSQLVINVKSSSGIVPATVDVTITFQFAAKGRTFPQYPIKVTGVPWSPDKKQFIIPSKTLGQVATYLVTAINQNADGAFATADAVPMPYSASLVITPVIPPAVLAAPFIVVQDVPVSGTISVTMSKEVSKEASIPAPSAAPLPVPQPPEPKVVKPANPAPASPAAEAQPVPPGPEPKAEPPSNLPPPPTSPQGDAKGATSS